MLVQIKVTGWWIFYIFAFAEGKLRKTTDGKGRFECLCNGSRQRKE